MLTLLAGLVSMAHQEPWFTDVTEAALGQVTTLSGSADKGYILEVNGGGLGLADLDLDGDLDLVVTDGSTVDAVRRGEPGRPPRVFLGHGDGTFEPAGDAWALDAGAWDAGLALGDLDGDFDVDLVVLGLGPVRVYRNDGGRGFEAVQPATDPSDPLRDWSTSGALLDFDGDGHLDLFIVRYLVPVLGEDQAFAASWKGRAVMRGPQGLEPLPDLLLRGRGDGTFEDVTEAAGIAAAPAAFGLGAMTLDVEGDGDVDVFVANDSVANHLWVNQGDGTFVERGLRMGLSHDGDGRAQASMGIAAGDLDGDGRDDLFVTNFSSEANTLYASRSGRSFRDHSSRRGVVGPSLHALGWGTAMQDVDLDGDLDAWVLNGHVYPQADGAGTDTSYAQPDQLLVQSPGGRLEARPLVAGAPLVSRAGVQGDLDDDGDLDVVVYTLDGAVRVLRNDAPRADGARWLGVRLAGFAGGNTAAVGAEVTLTIGERTLRRTIRTSGGFQASAPPGTHFAWTGEGAPEVSVRWPDGARETFGELEVGRWHVLERGADEPMEEDR